MIKLGVPVPAIQQEVLAKYEKCLTPKDIYNMFPLVSHSGPNTINEVLNILDDYGKKIS